jgi:hypothetical protein
MIASYTIIFFVFALAIYGRANKFPLRWGDAYRSTVIIKPPGAESFPKFFSSLKFRKISYDIQKAKQYYSLVLRRLV